MKKIGVIGGLGPESTIDYYRLIIDSYRKTQRNENYPEIIIYSLNINEVSDMMEAEQWDKLIDLLANAIKLISRAGADFALIAANTPHVVFDEVNPLSPIPMLSIVEETCKVIKTLDLKKVGLLGTKITMQSGYYQKVFTRYGITIVVPDQDEQKYIHKKIMTELLFGKMLDETRKALLSIVKNMIVKESIQGLILGCTELPLILKKDEFGIPFLNTTKIHAESAVKYCLFET